MAETNKFPKNDKFPKEEKAGSLLTLGRIPPQAKDMEQAVLGALLLEKNALHRVTDLLKVEMFYEERHKVIFDAILGLFQNSDPIDILTVKDFLRKKGQLEQAGGAYYLAELTSRVASAANIEYHSRVIAEKYILRQLILVSDNVIKDAYDETTDVFDLLDKTEQNLFEISETHLRRNYMGMTELVMLTLKKLEELKDKGEGMTGIPSGFTELDKLTSGWQKTDLVIVAARPAMGKTAFTLTVARNAAVGKGVPVAFFSLEMAAVQLTQRLICSEAELDAQKVRNGKLENYEWTQLISRIGTLSNAPIYIDDTPGISIMDLRAKCRRLKAEKKIEMVIIDYLQLMTGSSTKGGNREQEIAGISRALKEIAKELDVCVIALSQLSRAVETRGGDKKPQLSDLRESGCLAGDSLITDAETGRLVTIKSLAERTEQTPFSCLGVDEGMKVAPRNLVKAFYSGKKQVFELETVTGKKIKASANHPFLTIDGWKRLDKLQIGERLATPRNITVEKPSNPLAENELILLAHLIGDGCILPKSPYHYTSADMENIAIVNTCAKELFGIEGKIVQQENWWHTYLKTPYHLTHKVKHPITLWYDKLGLERVRSYDKKLPDSIFECDDARIALFLKHLWATDGNISWIRNKKEDSNRKDLVAIYYGTTSEKLAQQVQYLLLRFGIIAKIRVTQKGTYRKSYNVWIEGSQKQLNFLENIGCYGNRGKEIATMIVHLQTVQPNPNHDIIPKEIWKNVIEPIKMAAGMSWRDFTGEMGTAYSGSGIFKHGISRPRMAQIAEVFQSPILKNWAESDIYWEEIKSITPLEIEDVYDVTVDGVHNFISNSVISHNSIEQDADMVMALYRPEYYGFETDEEGNSTAGVAQVIILKQRNGPTGEAKMQFIGKYGKFADANAYGNTSNVIGSALNTPDTSVKSYFDGAGNTPNITIPSKMNEDLSGNTDDVPF